MATAVARIGQEKTVKVVPGTAVNAATAVNPLPMRAVTTVAAKSVSAPRTIGAVRWSGMRSVPSSATIVAVAAALPPARVRNAVRTAVVDFAVSVPRVKPAPMVLVFPFVNRIVRTEFVVPMVVVVAAAPAPVTITVTLVDAVIPPAAQTVMAGNVARTAAEISVASVDLMRPVFWEAARLPGTVCPC